MRDLPWRLAAGRRRGPASAPAQIRQAPYRPGQARRPPARPGHPGRRLAFDQETYNRHNVLERAATWLKECRAVATRFDKLALNYLATAKLAILQRDIRMLASNDPSDKP
ncbi:MAG TPA: hypothetical protein VG013_30365 [Gemmataceae bacterium]|jgi:transposase|nr:hypothetical protein [Gemmataceae bacterium]